MNKNYLLRVYYKSKIMCFWFEQSHIAVKWLGEELNLCPDVKMAMIYDKSGRLVYKYEKEVI